MGESDPLKIRSTLPPMIVEAVARAQHLVDSRPPGPYQGRWCAEALMVGDATALVMVAVANRED
jgi:hypothetical protein